MAGGVKISLIPDVSDLIRGTDNVSDAFDQVAGSLDDMAREAQRAGNTTGDSIERGAEQGTDALDKLTRSFKEMAKDATRQTKIAGDAVGDDMQTGTRHASESVSEFKDEARQNFSEVASSFSGGINGAADLVQGTLGGLAGSLAGPAGLAAGVLAGIGGAWFASMQENSEKQKALINSLVEDMISSGQKIASEGFIQSALQAIYTGADDAAVSVKALDDAVKLTGISSGTLARAYVGDADAITSATDAMAGQIQDAWDRAHNGPVAERAYWVQVAESVQAVSDKLTNTAAATDTAAARQSQYLDAVRAGGEAAQGSAARAGDAYDSLGRKIDALPKTVSVALDLDTSALDRYRSLLTRSPLSVGVLVRPGTQQAV